MWETGSLNIPDRLKESSAYNLVWFSRACKSTYNTYTMDCIDHEHYWWIDEQCVHMSGGDTYQKTPQFYEKKIIRKLPDTGGLRPLYRSYAISYVFTV